MRKVRDLSLVFVQLVACAAAVALASSSALAQDQKKLSGL